MFGFHMLYTSDFNVAKLYCFCLPDMTTYKIVTQRREKKPQTIYMTQYTTHISRSFFNEFFSLSFLLILGDSRNNNNSGNSSYFLESSLK